MITTSCSAKGMFIARPSSVVSLNGILIAISIGIFEYEILLQLGRRGSIFIASLKFMNMNVII